MPREAKPSIVGESPIRGGDIRTRWEWVEPSVWTDRMLAALENGVKEGKYAFFVAHGLFTLTAAYEAARQSR